MAKRISNNSTGIGVKCLMIVLLIWPILAIYGYPGGWDFAMMIVLPLSMIFFVIAMMKGGFSLSKLDPLPAGLFLYFVYWSVIMIVRGGALPINPIQIYLMFFLFFSLFDLKYFIKIFRFFGLICISLFVLQELTYHATGMRINGLIPGLPIHIVEDVEAYVDYHLSGNRSCSFFSEPAHFAQFLLPLFAIELYYDKSKYHIFYAVAIISVLILLRSGNGFIGLAPILLLSIPVFDKKSSYKTWARFLVVALVVSIAGYYFMGSEIGSSLLERQSELSSEYSGGSGSGFLRVWRGIFVFEDYSWTEKIIGCPNNDAQLAHVFSSGVLTREGAELYFNAFQKTLLNCGFIGMGIFIYVYWKIWQGNTVCGRAILLSLIVLTLISAIYMTHTMITYLLLAESMKKTQLYDEK